MDGLPISSKVGERRSKSKHAQTGKSSIIMGFFSCLAWLYIAGRLWQDAENRILLYNLLKANLGQRPKNLSVDDKLMILGCKGLDNRISEAEMDLTLAKSKGFIDKNILSSTSSSLSSSSQKLLAVIGVYTGFGSRLKRSVFRGTWMPRGDVLKNLEEKGVVIRFVIGRSANRGDSLDRNIGKEDSITRDFMVLDEHDEAEEERSKKIKFFLGDAVRRWDAEFYVKVEDGITLDLAGLVEFLEKRRGQGNAYIGCMKSGDVISQVGKPWYEPDSWKFGDENA